MKKERSAAQQNTNFLQLVNARHAVQAAYQNEELMVPVLGDTAVLMHKTPARQLEKLAAHLNLQHKLIPISGYRTVAEQTDIYEDTLKEKGEKFTRQYVALPGKSEHHTGLAIDLAASSGEIDFIRPHLPTTGVYQTFRKLCPRYGFVQRYTKEKESITDIANEPWHFRYVGRPHAEIMSKHNICLEEYIALLENHTSEMSALKYQSPVGRFALFTAEGKTATRYKDFYAKNRAPVQISDNNAEGVVFCLWQP